MVNKKLEDGAKQAMVENMFYDFYKKRWSVYGINFVRGIFFGVGSVLGGTVVLTSLIWLLGWLVDIPGGIGDFIRFIVDTVQNR